MTACAGVGSFCHVDRERCRGDAAFTLFMIARLTHRTMTRPACAPAHQLQTAHFVLQQRVQGQKRMRDAARDGDVDLVYDWLLVHPACANRKDRSLRPAVLLCPCLHHLSLKRFLQKREMRAAPRSRTWPSQDRAAACGSRSRREHQKPVITTIHASRVHTAA